jgi:hypothetical protein
MEDEKGSSKGGRNNRKKIYNVFGHPSIVACRIFTE